MDKCCFDYVWWEQFLGQFQDSAACAVNYIIGDQNVFNLGGTLDTIYLNGNPYAIGLGYSDEAGCRAAIAAAINTECGGGASEAGMYNSLGFNFFYVGVSSASGCELTRIDYTDDFAGSQTSSTVVSRTCDTACYNAGIITDGGGTEALDSMNIGGLDFYLDTAQFQLNNTAAMEANMQTFLENLAYTVDSVTATIAGGGRFGLQIVTNAPVQSVNWVTLTPASGTSNFSLC